MCLNLYVLLAANFKVHAEALKFLSTVLAFYQERRVLTPENAPGMDPALNTLIFELTSLGFQERSNLWASLGVKYLPSVLLKIRMIRLEDNDPTAEVPAVAGGVHLRNRRLLFRPTPDGFCILAENASAGRAFGEDADLTFTVHALNPHFASFADLPLGSPAGRRLYCTNAGRADGRLTEGDCVGEADLLGVVGPRFSYPVQAAGGARLVVRDEAGHSVWEAAAAGPVVPVDLSAHPEGRYAFFENEAPTGLRLVLKEAMGNPPALGFLRLLLPVDPAGAQRQYTLRFAARETTWRYRIRRRGLTDAPLSLTDSRGAVQFHAVPDPEYGQRFESDRRIAFRDRYDFPHQPAPVGGCPVRQAGRKAGSGMEQQPGSTAAAVRG